MIKLYPLISYLWILFILTVLVAPLVVGVMSRPKRAKPAKNPPPGESGMSEAPVEDQVLDFGDELAKRDSK